MSRIVASFLLMFLLSCGTGSNNKNNNPVEPSQKSPLECEYNEEGELECPDPQPPRPPKFLKVIFIK